MQARLHLPTSCNISVSLNLTRSLDSCLPEIACLHVTLEEIQTSRHSSDGQRSNATSVRSRPEGHTRELSVLWSSANTMRRPCNGLGYSIFRQRSLLFLVYNFVHLNHACEMVTSSIALQKMDLLSPQRDRYDRCNP